MTNASSAATVAGRPDAGTPTSTLDIVGCGVISAAGIGLAPVAAALEQPAPAGTPAEAGWPPVNLLPVKDFDPAALLGGKGLARATRTDQLAMAACLLAIEDAAGGPGLPETGIVLGTAVGSPNGLLDFFRDTFEQERPYLVNPSHFPGTLMNSAAGKAAIRQRMTGLNATVSGGPLAAMHALRYARTTMLAGRAGRLLAGGVEELSSASAWAWHRGGALARRVALAEGAAVFVLEPAGHREPLGRLLGSGVGFADPATGLPAVAGRLAETVETALARYGVAAGDVTTAVPGAGGRRGWAAVEERVLRRVLPDRRRLAPERVLGETHGAGTAMQLAVLLAAWRAGATDRVAVLTSVGFDGSVGCLVVAHPDFI